MKTYNDLLNLGDDEKKRKAFVRALINEHEASDDYKTAKDAYEYYRHRNATIMNYQKLLATVEGSYIPDTMSSNYKMATRHYYRFVTQEVQYLLGNGISWGKAETENKLGHDKWSIDRQTQDALTKARWGKVSFGYYNNGKVNVFSYLEFIPLFDETDGSMKAGVRYWQIDSNKPLRATLYEMDGYTKYVWKVKKDEPLQDTKKQKYIKKIASTAADGDEIYDEANYPEFPIVPLWANEEHQSSFVGLREQIDCYDMIKSGFANTVDEASIVYWTLQNAGGMNDEDLAKFVQQMRDLHATIMDIDGAQAQSHTIDVPYEAREKLLDRLNKDMYRDAMALDTENIAAGATTATQIRAAYENLNTKCDKLEYQVIDWLNGIMAVAGIEDEPTFTRSQIINQTEMVSVLLQAGQFLSTDYISRKLLDVLGDGDRADEVLSDMEQEDIDRLTGGEEPPDEEPTDEPIEE